MGFGNIDYIPLSNGGGGEGGRGTKTKQKKQKKEKKHHHKTPHNLLLFLPCSCLAFR